MLVVFTNGSFKVLSTIARLSGGTYEPIRDQTLQWRKGRQNFRRTEEFQENYFTPLLLCGKPEPVDRERWLLKCLSNDQTAFSGFTSLVEVVEDGFGYQGPIKLLPTAAFVEPFALRQLDCQDQQRLFTLREELQKLDSTRIEEINALLGEAERIAPINTKRKKGKSPIFFYSVTNKPFFLPFSLYSRMEQAAALVYGGISEIANRFRGSLDTALFGNSESNEKRQLYTGSIDFMVYGDDIYVVDIGSPAVGYIADIVFSSRAIGRKPEIGLDLLAEASGGEMAVYSRNANDLGFFAFELGELVNGLTSKGIKIDVVNGGTNEVRINGDDYPTENFDYLSRNQPLRNRILAAMRPALKEVGVNVPREVSTIPEQESIVGFYEKTRLGEDYGIVVKKRVLFWEFQQGSGYFKPLVVPLWSNELKSDRRTSTLFEQFVPSLVNVDIERDISGKRCYEIRMYFCVGDFK